MSRTKRYWFIAGLSTIMLIIATHYWIFSNEVLKVPEESFSFQEIEKVEVTRSKRDIHLNVYLRKPSSCDRVVKILEIESFDIKANTYVPKCTEVGKHLIKIVYKKSSTV